MTYNECLQKREIIQNYQSVNLKVDGESYTICVGDKFSKLEVVDLVQYKEGNTKRRGCICKCSCSDTSFIGPSRLNMLITGELVSCGCYQREVHSKQMIQRNTKHGFSTRKNREHLYVIWGSMMDRATNHNRADAKYYSNKGIEVCDEWRDYTIFRDWALSNGYKEGLSIDRKDNSDGYNPSNCRWIPLKDQNSNKTSNRYLDYNGLHLTITEWGRRTGLSWDVINRRLSKGMSVGQALGYE